MAAIAARAVPLQVATGLAPSTPASNSRGGSRAAPDTARGIWESPTTTQATVIAQAGGHRLEASHDAGVPAKLLSEQWDKLSQKFRALTRPVVGNRADALYEQIAQVETLPAARDLLDSARPKLA